MGYACFKHCFDTSATVAGDTMSNMYCSNTNDSGSSSTSPQYQHDHHQQPALRFAIVAYFSAHILYEMRQHRTKPSNKPIRIGRGMGCVKRPVSVGRQAMPHREVYLVVTGSEAKLCLQWMRSMQPALVPLVMLVLMERLLLLEDPLQLCVPFADIGAFQLLPPLLLLLLIPRRLLCHCPPALSSNHPTSNRCVVDDIQCFLSCCRCCRNPDITTIPPLPPPPPDHHRHHHHHCGGGSGNRHDCAQNVEAALANLKDSAFWHGGIATRLRGCFTPMQSVIGPPSRLFSEP